MVKKLFITSDLANRSIVNAQTYCTDATQQTKAKYELAYTYMNRLNELNLLRMCIQFYIVKVLDILQNKKNTQ